MDAIHYKRFKISSEGICEQLLLSTQMEKLDCTKWALSLLDNQEVVTSVSVDMLRWLESSSSKSLLAYNNLRDQSLSSSIITFTSAVEHYFKHRIISCLLKNQGLRKKGFSTNVNQDSQNPTTLFKAIDLENHKSLDHAKLSVIKKLSSIYSKGGVFSEKYTKVSKFLDIEASLVDKSLEKSLDSIWSLRNIIAHTNVDKIKKWQIIQIDGVQIEYKRHSSEEYLWFVLEFIKIAEKTKETLNYFDINTRKKWPPLIPISETVLNEV